MRSLESRAACLLSGRPPRPWSSCHHGNGEEGNTDRSQTYCQVCLLRADASVDWERHARGA
jgi:hypothetical protein